MAAVKARVASYIDCIIRGVAHREFHLNRAQMCVIPLAIEAPSHATRRRTS